MTPEPTTVSTWWDAVTSATSDAWSQILSFLPNLIGAFVIILIGIIVAYILKWIVAQVLTVIQLQTLSDKVKLTDILKKMGVTATIPELLGNMVKWIVLIVFLLPALQVLGLSQVTYVLHQILGYLPNVIVAGFVVLVGVIIADIIAHAIRATALSIGATTANVLATVAKYAIWVFVGLAALVQLGVATTLLITLFTGFVAAVAIAVGLSFGLGGRDAASDLIKKVREEFSKK